MIRPATSFNDDEVLFLEEALRVAKESPPHPPRDLVTAPEMGSVLKKLQMMRRALRRNRAEQERLIALGKVRL